MAKTEEEPRVLDALTEEEACLWAILSDPSGLDLAEFLFHEPKEPTGTFRAWAYQIPWFRCNDKHQIEQGSRSGGKTTSIIIRMVSFPFRHPGEEAMITAPELVHLDPITDLIERKLYESRLTREMLPPGRSGITHRMFLAKFLNGSRIYGRLPHTDGKGILGAHPTELEMDESSIYPPAGWTELIETMQRGVENSTWRAHGVSRGLRDKFFEFTQEGPNNPFKVIRFTAMHRPTWSDKEREEKINTYGSKDSPDYRRNILGLHGDAQAPLFHPGRLGNCLHKDTMVKVIRDGQMCLERIADIGMGTRVVNAIGTGVVRRTIPSYHRKILHLRVDGSNLYCTPDHPILTIHGWRQAGEVKQGDLIVTDATMRNLSQSSYDFMEGERRDSGQMVGLAGVESAEVYEQGSSEFARLSGGQDTITCYDLTVSGHPSFAVGELGLLVHNCTDSDASSDYNSREYKITKITTEELTERGERSVLEFLEMPATHKGYAAYWAGADLGITKDPTEILIAGEMQKNGQVHLKLLHRIRLERMSAPIQSQVFAWLIQSYRPKRFALDKGGIGNPMFQHLQADHPDLAAQTQAFNFGEKILVGFDEAKAAELTIGMDEVKEAGIMRYSIEEATDVLRDLVDRKQITLPWDTDLIRQMSAQTYRSDKSDMDVYGRARRIFSRGEFHALDGLRFMALGWSQYKLEEMMKMRKPQEYAPVYDYVVDLG